MINESENTLNQSNIHNNNQTAVTLNGDNNTLIQNNITGSQEAILIENGPNNTLNYNRIAGNNHSLTNEGNGTVNAQYNWWGKNTPTEITGENIDTSNQVVADLNVNNTPGNIIQPGEIYNVTITLRSADGKELAMAIPSFVVQFFFNGGDIYPENVTVTNNTAWTQLQIFNPGSYTLTAVLDQQTLTSVLSTHVNSQPVNPDNVQRIPRKPSEPAPNNNLCGAVALANLLGGLGIQADASIIAPLAGTNEFGTTFYGLIEAAKLLGVDLKGVNLDSSQLQSGDIVLLNMNGINHYSTVLLHTGNLIVLQDPLLGTVILTMDQFNEIYTGHALTLNDVGTHLSSNELQSFSGGNLNSNSDYQKLETWWNNLPQKNKEEALKRDGEFNVFKNDDLTSSIFDKVNRYTFKTGNNVFGIPGRFEQLVFDPNNPLGLTSEEKKWATEHMIKMDNRTPEQKKADEDLLRIIVIGILLVGVGLITAGAGDIAILGEAGLEAEEAGVATETAAETTGETGLLDGISEWGSSNLNLIKDFLIDNLHYAGISTSSPTAFILDTLSWVTFSFGPNPVGGAMLALRILALTRIPWLAENVPYNSVSASMTLTDLFALILGVKGLSDSIWDGIKTGIGELWNNLTNSQNNKAYNGAWMINIPGAINGLVNGASDMGKWINDSASNLNGWISSKTNGFLNDISDLGKSIGDSASKLGNWINTGISNATNAISNFASGVGTAASNFIDNIKSAAINTYNQTKSNLIQQYNNLKYAAVNNYNAVKSAAVNTYHTVKSVATKTYNYIKGAAQNTYNYLKGAINNTYNYIKGAAQNTYNYLKGTANNVVNTASSGVNWFKGLIGWH